MNNNTLDPRNTRFLIDKIITSEEVMQRVKNLERLGTLADIMKLEYFEHLTLSKTNKAVLKRANSDHVLELSLYQIYFNY